VLSNVVCRTRWQRRLKSFSWRILFFAFEKDSFLFFEDLLLIERKASVGGYPIEVFVVFEELSYLILRNIVLIRTFFVEKIHEKEEGIGGKQCDPSQNKHGQPHPVVARVVWAPVLHLLHDELPDNVEHDRQRGQDDQPEPYLLGGVHLGEAQVALAVEDGQARLQDGQGELGRVEHGRREHEGGQPHVGEEEEEPED